MRFGRLQRRWTGLTPVLCAILAAACGACRAGATESLCDPTSHDFVLQSVLFEGAPCHAARLRTPATDSFLVSAPTGHTNEAGLTVQFTIALLRIPTTSVSINYQSTDTTEGIPAGTSVQFSPSNWNVPQTISVTGQNDVIQDGNQAYKITFSPAVSSDSTFAGLTAPAVNLINDDDEAPIFRIFLTTAATNGNLGGVAGADALCNADVAKPTADTYKALIVDGVNRRASVTSNAGDGQIDWALRPSTTYFRPDNVTPTITTTPASVFAFGLLANSFGTTANQYWTGLGNDWVGTAANCNSWSTVISVSGNVGQADQSNANSISIGTQLCLSNAPRLLCVQQ